MKPSVNRTGSSSLGPNFAAIDTIAAHCDAYSGWCSNTIRTGRSRTSGEYRFDVSDMTPSSQGLESATLPERFNRLRGWSDLSVAGALAPATDRRVRFVWSYDAQMTNTIT